MSNRLRSSLAAASLLAGLCLPVSAQDALPPANPTAAVVAPDAPAGAPLLLEECVQRALQHGFDIEIQRYNPSHGEGFGRYRPGRLRSNVLPERHAKSRNTGPVTGNLGIKNDARDARLSVDELLQTGTTVNLSTELSRSATNPFSPLVNGFYNPIYNSDLTVTVTQPLLRGAGTAVTTAVLNRAKIGLTRAGFDFRAQVLNIVQQTEIDYYSLVYAREQLRVYRVSLVLANRLLEEAQAKKTVAPPTDVDVLQAQVGRGECTQQCTLRRKIGQRHFRCPARSHRSVRTRHGVGRHEF